MKLDKRKYMISIIVTIILIGSLIGIISITKNSNKTKIIYKNEYSTLTKKATVKTLKKTTKKTTKKTHKKTTTIPMSWQDNGIFKNYYKKAYTKLKKLTLDEKIGQLLLVKYSSKTSEEAIKKYHISGFVYYEDAFKDKSLKGVKNMISSAQKKSRIPLITSVDEEGGNVVRISSNKKLISNSLKKYPNLFYYNKYNKLAFKPSSMLYKEGGYPLIEKEVKVKSDILSNLGINVNLAPVVDISSKSSYIYHRTLTLGIDKTSEYARRVIKTSKKTKVSYTLKHFPGYGNNLDTHEVTSMDKRDLNYLKNNDLKPFIAGINAGSEFIMISHNKINAIDKNNPASLSKNVHKLLPSDLKYTGLIITDALDMGALDNINNKYVKAFKAGNHLLIVNDYKKAHKEIKKNIKESDIDKLVFKVLAWKYYKGLLK